MTTKAKVIELLDQMEPEQQEALLQLISSFLVKNEAPTAPQPRPKIVGSLPGVFIMAPDFDEPLEDFKDYM